MSLTIKKLNKKIPVYDINVENVNNFYGNDILVHNCVESFSPFNSKLTHTCNLLSINLNELDDESRIPYISKLAVEIMDNTIDLTNSPIEGSKIHNDLFRTIGIGFIGYADYLAKRNIPYEDSVQAADNLFEQFSYYTADASIDLAEQRGFFKGFPGSDWENGTMINKYYEKSKTTDNDLNWGLLQSKIDQSGIRNGLLMAIAPNSGTSLLMSATASILPTFSKFYVEKNSKGSYPVCPPNIKTNMWGYKEYKHCNTQKVTSVVSTIQKWIDTGISYELSYDTNSDVNATDIYKDFIHIWKSKIKAIYYVRFIQKNSNTPDKSDCVSCSN